MSFSENQLFIGVGLAVGSSIISNLGLNLQKLTHVRLEARKAKLLDAQRLREEFPSAVSRVEVLPEDSTERYVPTSPGCPFYLQPMWLLGISLVIAGAVADFMALGFADQIIVAPIGSMTLVTNLLFAPFFSKEKLTKMDVFATVIIVCGCTVAVIFARPEQPVEYTMDSFLRFYSDPRFLFYIVAIFGIVALVFRGIVKVESSLKSATEVRKRGERKGHEGEYVLVTDVPKLDDDEQLHLLHRLAGEWWGRIVLLEYTRFGYACIAGVTGAQSVMFAKAIAVTVVNGEWQYFQKPLTYVILGGLGASIYLQLKWSNKALQHFDALYVVPVFQAFWIGFSIISGMIVYQESQKLTWLQLGLFSVGVMITMSGIYILSQHAEEHTSRDRVHSQRIKVSLNGRRSRAPSIVSIDDPRGSWHPSPHDNAWVPAMETTDTSSDESPSGGSSHT